ncbi:basic leucine zipper 2-like isoform X2 [Phragmites australis]|uniref:basic leucine zipper 2-like isoform X2 n=1 Tax=Phragmites australis TaxID=29695 RepID=UPI002D79B3B2|nr:basic leucine zipper 2-like isoform X2 [Phragmites australis]
MAQLPPKIPTMAPTWPEFGGGHHHHAHHHQRSPSVGAFLAAPMPPLPPQHQQQPSWVDEFLDFSAAKRGAHRRSVSDSVAFLEAGPDDNAGVGAHDFYRLDDDQLLSMFSDDLPPPPPQAAPAPCSSSPSDHNSINDEKPDKGETEEAQSECNGDAAAAPGQPASHAAADPKRVKRILANRQSAQRSRVRKLQYISELERSVTSLQTEVSALSPRVAFLDHQRSLLTLGNSHLKQRIAALAQDKIFKDAHQEALKREIERLRQIYHQQSLKNVESPTADAAPIRSDKDLIASEGAAAPCPPS